MKLKRLLFAVLPFTAFLALSIHAYGQGIITGGITGTVVDQSGAVVPSAEVTAVDPARGAIFKTQSDGAGNFAFRDMPIGSYDVSISAANFQQLKINGVTVTAGEDQSLKKQTLTIGASTSVTVEGASTVQLDTTQSQVAGSFDSQQLQNLPLGNGFDEVALLMPGVAQTHDDNFSNTNGPNFSSNGERGRSNNFELDGQSNNDNSVAGPQIFFGNQDAIAEIQVIQSNFSAQYGRNTGSVVNYITKSGTNSFHGSGFEFYTGSWLNSFANQYKSPLFGYCPPGVNPSTGCTAPSIPRSVDNKWGGTLGGPILKDKLWFFGSTYWEHTRNGSTPFNSGSSLTPTPTGLQQLAATFPGNPVVSILTDSGPYGVKLGNPQPILSSATTTPVTAPDGSTVNIQVAPVVRSLAAGDYADEEDLGRIDWQATPKDRFYFRYFYQNDVGSLYDFYGAAGTFYDVPDANYSVGADETHQFSSFWVNQLRYSYQESKLDFQAGSFPTCTVTTFPECPGYIQLGGTNLSFGEATNLPQGRTVKVTQVQDNASWTHGRQTILFGGEYDYQNSPNVFLPLYNGSGSFGTLDDFVHQNGNFLLATGNPILPFTESDFALYFQDDWKVSPSLTLNLGLRWEFFGQAINELHRLTVARESNPTTAIWDPSLPLADRTTPAVNNAWKNYEPRIGFAWNPPFDKRMVVRGGYSINFDPQFYNIFLNVATVAPAATSGSFPCGGACLSGGSFTGASLRATNLPNLPIGGNPAYSDQEIVPSNFHNPYGQTYSLGFERQITNTALLSVRYVGNHTSGNFQSVDGNPNLNPDFATYGLPQVATAFPSYVPVSLCTTPGAPGLGRPDCNKGNLSVVGNYAFSIYNGLQTQVTMRTFHGFTGNVNYTWSRTIDNTSEIYSTYVGGNTIAVPQNPLNNSIGELGVSGNSYPNVFSVGMVYQVPQFHTSSNILSRIVNGFQANGIYQYNSGQPFNAYQPLLNLYGLDSSYCDTAFNQSSVGPGADSCRLILSNKGAPLNSVAILYAGTFYELGSFLNTNNPATIAPSAVHWLINNSGTANLLNNPYPGSGRNILRAQPYNNFDASIFKTTKLTERVDMQLQLTAFNSLNHQYRGTPLANVFNDTPGIPVNPFLSNLYNTSVPRSVQLGGKLRF
jgi:hypothetical protein